jgi:ABC-2 type transport system ATP-binding protein
MNLYSKESDSSGPGYFLTGMNELMTGQNADRQKSNSDPVLIAAELTKTYRGASSPALDGCSIEIEEGEIFGLLGPNGAGKTTAISILSTMIRPDRGRVIICGTDALKYPYRVKKMIGLVPQDIALYPTLTARENLIFFSRCYGLNSRQLRGRIHECLEFVGLADRTDKQIATYSGGMKRRVNLAAGLLHQPRLLFLDEPTVGIDAQSRNLVLERLLQLKESGTTMIYTTHYMEEAEHLCSTVAIIDEGRIIARGTPQELISRPPGYSSLGELFLALTGKQLRD